MNLCVYDKEMGIEDAETIEGIDVEVKKKMKAGKLKDFVHVEEKLV